MWKNIFYNGGGGLSLYIVFSVYLLSTYFFLLKIHLFFVLFFFHLWLVVYVDYDNDNYWKKYNIYEIKNLIQRNST